MRTTSSIASSSRRPSLRMCEMYLPREGGRDLAQLDQLGGVDVVSRGVLQGRRDAEGAVTHFGFHEPAHLVQFGRRRLPVAPAEDVLAHGRRPEERCHVLGDTAPL